MEKELLEKIYTLAETETTEAQNELSELIKPVKKGTIGIAQINPILGDLECNAKKIVKYIHQAENIGLETIIFPELSLIGYPVEDTLDKHSMLIKENLKWLNAIAQNTKNITAIVGFVEPTEKTNKYYNSVAIIYDGQVKDIIRKTNTDTPASNDYRYFKNAPQKLTNINDKKYKILIGEFTEQQKDDADIIVNCASTISRPESEIILNKKLSQTAKNCSIPIVYVNQTGAIDSYSFGGGSCVYNSDGELIAKAKSFEEQLLITNPFENFGKIYPSPYKKQIENENFSLDYDSDLERTYYTLIQGIKDYFNKTGFERAVLGLSGGLDSTVCAVLLADALGAKNIYGISMPSKITSQESKSDAQILAQNLGINFSEAPIKEMFDTTNNCLQKLFKEIEQNWNNRYTQSFTPDNIQARSRAMFLWCISNEFGKTLPIATSDKSEAYVGYATINGDMSGGFAPIADITKTKLFALARWLNKNRTQKNVIPQSIIDKRPGAELAINPKTGKPLIAEDALMPYEFLDEIIWRIENKKECYADMLNSEFLYEKQNNITKEQKIEWLEKFYRRNAAALYKKSILPPYIIVDSHSVKNYIQPITSHVNYKGYTEKEISEKLQNIK